MLWPVMHRSPGHNQQQPSPRAELLVFIDDDDDDGSLQPRSCQTIDPLSFYCRLMQAYTRG